MGILRQIHEVVDELRKYESEREWFEFKKNNSEPHIIGEYLSALSNSAALNDQEYGYLIYGIDDKTHEAVGTRFRPKSAKGKGNEDLEPWLSRLSSPKPNFQIFEIDYNEKNLVVFRIECAKIQPVKFDGTEYVRVASYKHKLSEYPEKERKLWAITSSVPFEKALAKKAISGDEILRCLDYPDFFDKLEIPLPDNRKGIMNKLIQEGIITKEGNYYSITNLGAVLFAKNLDYFPSLSRRKLRIINYSGKNRLNAQNEHVIKKGYAVSFEDAVDWIYSHIPSSEIIEDALRVEKKMFPKVAIREIVANALIHQDFLTSGSDPMVEIFENRMEISNPGRPIIEPIRFIDHPPKSRNEILAAFMRRINICEERGSGIDRAVNAIETAQLPAPDFQENEDFMRVILFGHKELTEMTRDERVRACYQHCCIKWIDQDFMTNASLRKRLGIEKKNYSLASRIIKETTEKGYIKRSDSDNRSNKYLSYVPFWV